MTIFILSTIHITKLAVVWPAIGVAASRRVLNRGRVLHRRRVLNWRRVPEAVLICEAVLVDHHGVDAMDVCGVGCDDDDDDDDDGADSGAKTEVAHFLGHFWESAGRRAA